MHKTKWCVVHVVYAKQTCHAMVVNHKLVAHHSTYTYRLNAMLCRLCARLKRLHRIPIFSSHKFYYAEPNKRFLSDEKLCNIVCLEWKIEETVCAHTAHILRWKRNLWLYLCDSERASKQLNKWESAHCSTATGVPIVDTIMRLVCVCVCMS